MENKTVKRGRGPGKREPYKNQENKKVRLIASVSPDELSYIKLIGNGKNGVAISEFIKTHKMINDIKTNIHN